MKRIAKQFLWLSIFAAAMAVLEAVVVAYIRQLLHVTPETVSLGSYEQMEMWREVATLVMLATVGLIAGRTGLERLAYTIYTFGFWDIWYYIWLKIFLDWPDSIFHWDILFLIPLRWHGPVISPILIAGLMCLVAVLGVIRLQQKRPWAFTQTRIITLTGGCLLALYTFMASPLHGWLQGIPNFNELRPESFPWLLFLIAFAFMAVPALQATWPVSRE